MKHRTLLLLVGVGALLAGGLLGGVIQASASPSTTYYACLFKGKLSHVGTTPPTCSKGIQISWNQQGPAGLPGTPGTNGVSHGYSQTGTKSYLTNGAETIVSVTPAVGDYVVTAHVGLYDVGDVNSAEDEILCDLNGAGLTFDQAEDFIPGGSPANITLTGTFATSSAFASIGVICSDPTVPESTIQYNASITAVQVNALN